MTGPKDPPLQRGGGRVLVFGGVGLAVAAAAVLALGADDASLLRLGILAALWAALFGIFAAVRLRREVDVGAERADELRTIYRLELDREIAARREHELTVERELRAQAERRERDELAALRGELQSLREALRNLLGGDVLVERVALRAESTRLLPMPDHSRPVADAHGRAADRRSAGPSRSLTVAESPGPDIGRDPWDLGHRPDPPQRRREPADVPARPAAQSQSQSPREAPPWQPAVSSGPPAAHRRRVDSRQDTPEPPPVPPVPQVPDSAGETGVSTFQDNDPPGAVFRPGTSTGRHSRPSVPRYGAAPQVAPTSNGTGAHRNGNGVNGTGVNGTGVNGTGSHSSHAGRQTGTGHRRAAEETPAEPPTGGRRVDELLAAYGDGAAPRRRRRRIED